MKTTAAGSPDAAPLDASQIAPIVGRSPTAARQLASRARRRVQGSGKTSAYKLLKRRAI